jgi:methylmalonyl-CoA mutase N-terminal domain/subunit
VGVNEFVTEEDAAAPRFQLDPGVGAALVDKVQRVRAGRDRDAVARGLDAVDRAARGRDNLMVAIVDAVDASVTLGEICDRLRGVFGMHQPAVTF